MHSEQLIGHLQNGSIRGLIFDFDGTLLDIAESLRNSIKEVFEENKIVSDMETTIQEIGALMETIQGYPLPKIILQSYDMFKYISSLNSLTFMKKIQIAALIFSRYLTLAKEAPIFPNADKYLRKLHKSYDLYIVSHNQTKNIIAHLEKHDLMNLFKGIYGADLLPALKPDPNALKPVFDRYKSVKLKEFVMIGDMPSDIMAGVEAGVWTIALTTGVSNRNILSEQGASLVLDSLSELLQITEKK
ncbi:MAG: HAD family hydrolase [Candidatus Lokiarchaeota archaeon]|nr:HAD family hydrolase [Candidatus Lokiarchaeota archaeon]